MSDDDDNPRRGPVVPLWGVLAVIGVLAVGVTLGILLAGGGDKGSPAKAAADTQTVRFQRPTDPGPKPFTPPADHEGAKTVSFTPSTTDTGPFGGSGSNVVCDRDRLIRYLKANPDRLRAWAQALGVTPTYRAVRRYIAGLHPVTLTHDTRVTNHTYAGGIAVGFQSILQAGTAVLVDDYGRPVVRCRCGNPLSEPVFIPTAHCYGCPPHYAPPQETCTYWQRTTTYRRRWTPDGEYTNSTYDEIFIRRSRGGPFDNCWTAYPDPPVVRIIDVYTGPPTTTTTTNTTTPPPARTGTPTAYFTPSDGTVGDVYTLHASGFPANTPVSIVLTRPDGVVERYGFTTDASGSGTYTFARTGTNTVLGTYTAVISGGGRTTTASTHVSSGQRQTPAPTTTDQAPPTQTAPSTGGDLQCHPPRSQLEFEQCVDSGQIGHD